MIQKTRSPSETGQGGTVLLLGNYRPTQVIARRLKACGFRVLCGLEGYEGDAERSRFVDEGWDHPSLVDTPDSFQDALIDILKRRPDITHVAPISEPAVRYFAERDIPLPAPVQLATMDGELVRRCLDKNFMMDLARDVGVPIAPFAQVRDLDEFHSQAAAIGFPMVVRPASADQLLLDRKAVILADQAAFARLFPTWPAGHDVLMLQKRVEGLRHNIYFSARDGRIKRVLHALITRTDMADGSGLALDGETRDPDPALLADCRALLGALSYTGIGCAQFLVDPQTGVRSFLEINPRIAGNHAVPEYCGMDLTGVLFGLCEDPAQDTRDAAGFVGRSGVRYSWLARDLRGCKGRFYTDASGIGAYIASVISALVVSVRADLDVGFTLRDPLPGLMQICDELPLIGKLTRRRHRTGDNSASQNRKAPKMSLEKGATS